MPLAVGDEAAVKSRIAGVNEVQAVAEIPAAQATIVNVEGVAGARARSVFIDDRVVERRHARGANPCGDGQGVGIQAGVVGDCGVTVGAVKTQAVAGGNLGKARGSCEKQAKNHTQKDPAGHTSGARLSGSHCF